MTLLLDQVIHDMRNKGNVALLQSAIQRLKYILPDAQVNVITDAPLVLNYYCPQARAVSVNSKQSPRRRFLMPLVERIAPKAVIRCVIELREELKSRRSSDQCSRWLNTLCAEDSTKKTASFISQGASTEEEVPSEVLRAVEQADIIITTGGGYLCDYDRQPLIRTLAILQAAVDRKKPTAMVGQGVGPLDDTDLRKRLSRVLPSVDLILVRERRIAPDILMSLGVPASRIIMTGDDAIEMSYQQRNPCLGRGVGISFRVAPYTQVVQVDLERIRPILQAAAQKHKFRMLALPISHYIQEDDRLAEGTVLEGFQRVPWFQPRFGMPKRTVESVSKCRIVIAGTFHAAVFALAQGIPVVGVVRSSEYRNKFLGLQHEFGVGCKTLSLDDEHFEQLLTVAIDEAWENAEQLRSGLLRNAERQIDLAAAGYNKLRTLILSCKGGAQSRSIYVKALVSG